MVLASTAELFASHISVYSRTAAGHTKIIPRFGVRNGNMITW